MLFPVLAARVGDSLRFSFSWPEAPHTQIIDYLREKELLLILDNCEHLPAVDAFVLELLEQAPGCAILATSRSRLNIRGERAIEPAGLPFPDMHEAGPPAANGARQASQRLAPGVVQAAPRGEPRTAHLAHYTALDLFQHSAQAVDARFTWTPANTAAATRICALVDGLPLGIELAASLV